MNHRYGIIRDVYKFYVKRGPHNYGLAHRFPSFVEGNPEYVAALNQLMYEKLILYESVPSDTTGKNLLAIGINPDSLEDIRKELSPWYRDPKFLIPAIIGVLGLLWAVLTILL
jgi:hypothetical protein